MGQETLESKVAVIGGGPGGYAAAFRSADLGLEVTLISDEDRLGGACLLRGCIPSKSLLEVSALINQTRQAEEWGVKFSPPEVDLAAINSWKDSVIQRMVNGLDNLAKRRDINVIKGRAVFDGSDQLRLENSDISYVKYEKAILATGSSPIKLANALETNGRIMNSTSALKFEKIPDTLLVIGAGYIGLELGMVYASLGSQVTLVELTDEILPGMDRDLVRPLEKSIRGQFKNIILGSRVTSIKESADNVEVGISKKDHSSKEVFDRVLVAIGRKPSTENLGLENTSVQLDSKGFVLVDEQRRTNDKNIFAVGDITSGPMLAHKAMYEGKIAADVIAGKSSAYDVRAVPAVVYTDPEIALTGLSENDARRLGYDFEVARFSWMASGRALSMGIPDGLTKIIVDGQNGNILGMGIVGRGAENMISEGTLAIEMGALAEDLALTIHPHPTLSESESEAAEIYLGFPIHVLPPKKNKIA